MFSLSARCFVQGQLNSDLALCVCVLHYHIHLALDTSVKLNFNVNIVNLYFNCLPVFLVCVMSPLLQLATEYGIKFMETSAKASINVEEVSECDRP